MRVDLYTKIVLTVIAVCLIALVFKQTDIISEAHAQGHNGTMDVRIVGISTNDELNVDISRISTYSSLDVNVSQKSFSTLDVRVTNTPDVSIKNSYIYTKDY